MRREPTFAIVLAGAAAFLSLYCTQPLLPLLARTFHASTFDVGLTITAPTIAVAIFAPLVGRLADRTGLRRVIVASAFLLAIATALAATSTTLRQLLLWRFVQGVITPGIFAGSIAYIHEEWPPERAGRGTGAYMTGTILGGFTGRAVAGLVAVDFNRQASFAALAVLTFAMAAALLACLPADRTPLQHHGDLGRRGSLLQHLHNRQLVTTYAIGFCVLFTQVAMFTYVTFHLAAPPYSLSTAGKAQGVATSTSAMWLASPARPAGSAPASSSRAL
jgi:YNFM family putative membrane transporter